MPQQDKFKYSLILATRERINLFVEMLQSIRDTVEIKKDLEVVAIIDDDDLNMQKCSLNLMEEFKDISLKIIPRQRSEWMNKDYINYSYSFTSGDYIIVLNDDVIFINNSWDVQAYQVIKSYCKKNPDEIFLGFTENFNGNNRLCYFPLLSRKTIKSLGFVMPPKRKSWGADVDLCDLFLHPKVNRVLNLSCIQIKHINFRQQKMERDEISLRMENIFHSHEGHFDLNLQVDILMKHLKGNYETA